jgi:hypothetical protein
MRYGFLVSFLLAWSVDASAQGPPEYSFSSEQARQRKTLITKVSMVPGTIKWQKWEITVGDAWLEKCKDGGCYLCFRIEKGKEAFMPTSNTILVLEDLRMGIGFHLGVGLRWAQGVQYLESPDLSKARLSLIENWKQERLKNIRFIPTTDAPK